MKSASILFLCGLLVAAGSARAQSADHESLVIFARNLWTGKVLLQDARVLVKDGRIVSVVSAGEREAPAAARVMEVAWLLPGLVMADSVSLTATLEDPVSVTPAIRAVDGYDPFIPRPELESSGVTAVYLSPGRTRLIAGIGGVIRPGVEDPDLAIIAATAALHGSVIEAARRPQDVFQPPVAPAEDAERFPPAKPQLPHTRAGAFLALRELFLKARGPDGERVPRGRYEKDLRPVRAFLDGKMPLRLRAETAADIFGAIQVARRFKARLVIEGGTEAWRLAEELAEVGASVVLATGTPPTGRLSPPPPFNAPGGRPHPQAAALLKRAGVKVALVPAATGAFSDLLWYAGQAMTRGGFDREDVLRAVTSGAAGVLGVQDDCGFVAPGRAADLVAFDQDPLAPAAHPILVVAAGQILHRSDEKDEEESRPVAIFARRIHTAAGAPIENGVVLVQDGRIVDVGSEVTVPAGARRVSLENAVVVPGFVDAGTQAGMRGYRMDDSGVLTLPPPQKTLPMDKPPSESFDPRFPEVRAVAEAGVTTLVLAPAGGRAPAGLLSVVKTGGEPGPASVVASVAGVLFDYSSATWSPSVLSSLRRTLKSGRKYARAWKEYEEKLAAWKAKHPDTASPRRAVKPGKIQAPKARDPVTGSWSGTAEYEGLLVKVKAEFALDGKSVSGTVHASMIPGGSAPVEGVFENDVLSLQMEIQGTSVEVTLDVGRDEMEGLWRAEGAGEGRIVLKRRWKPAAGGDKKDGSAPAKQGKKGSEKGAGDSTAKKAASGDKPPKQPRKVAAMEPYRRLFTLEIPAFVGVARSPRLAREILRIFRDEFELKTVFVSPRLVKGLIDEMGRLGVGLACTGPAVYTEEGTRVNPALIAIRNRVPAILRSGPGGDSRTLYHSAAYLVRCGLSPADALKMITRWPARIFGLGKRLGTIQRGRDADLVILDGEPFAPGTHILKVMVNGRFVGEKEKE